MEGVYGKTQIRLMRLGPFTKGKKVQASSTQLGPTRIVWRDYHTCTGDGKHWEWTSPILPDQDGEMVLRRILCMPRAGKKAIGYDEAFRMFEVACVEECSREGSTYDSTWNLRRNFVGWVSAQGYYIDLKHDEYKIEAGRH
jgi:hypothetical protein